MSGLILHHYDTSPFSEKVRLMLGLKGLAWDSVQAPVIMPKPELTPLTGGYRRIPVLQIGANYYNDVEARFGLQPALVERMRLANILYDEDAGGQFFQFYSAPRPDGFFFEIVQRDGYAGYGAANAGIRLTAQSRLARPISVPAPSHG